MGKTLTGTLWRNITLCGIPEPLRTKYSELLCFIIAPLEWPCWIWRSKNHQCLSCVYMWKTRNNYFRQLWCNCNANKSSTAVYRLTIIEISIVNNQLSSQSRDSEPSRHAGDEFFSRCMVVLRFMGISERWAFGQYLREPPATFIELKLRFPANLSQGTCTWRDNFIIQALGDIHVFQSTFCRNQCYLA